MTSRGLALRPVIIADSVDIQARSAIPVHSTNNTVIKTNPKEKLPKPRSRRRTIADGQRKTARYLRKIIRKVNTERKTLRLWDQKLTGWNAKNAVCLKRWHHLRSFTVFWIVFILIQGKNTDNISFPSRTLLTFTTRFIICGAFFFGFHWQGKESYPKSAWLVA